MNSRGNTHMIAAARSAQGIARHRPSNGRRWLPTHLTVMIVALLLSACASGGGSSDTTGSTAPPAPDTSPCAGPNGVGDTVPAGLGPGDLVAAVDLTPANASSPGFPTGARVWRMLYVSTGVDEGDLQLICGLVAAPTAGPTTAGGRGRLLNWTHGTVGVAQGCLPSSDPAGQFWGKMVGGINAIAWGSDLGKHEGDPAGGLLQYAMNQGMVVTATDYQPDDAYVAQFSRTWPRPQGTARRSEVSSGRRTGLARSGVTQESSSARRIHRRPARRRGPGRGGRPPYRLHGEGCGRQREVPDLCWVSAFTALCWGGVAPVSCLDHSGSNAT